MIGKIRAWGSRRRLKKLAKEKGVNVRCRSWKVVNDRWRLWSGTPINWIRRSDEARAVSHPVDVYRSSLCQLPWSCIHGGETVGMVTNQADGVAGRTVWVWFQFLDGKL